MKKVRLFILICAVAMPLFLFTGKGEAAKTIWQNPGDSVNKLVLAGAVLRFFADNPPRKNIFITFTLS